MEESSPRRRGELFAVRLWRRLTEPAPAVLPEVLRRRSRLLLSLLVIFFVVLLILFAVSPLQMLSSGSLLYGERHRFLLIVSLATAMVVVVLAYLLARKGMYRLSAALIIAMNLVGTFVDLLGGASPVYLGFPVLGLILSSLLLSHRATLVVWCLTLSAMLLLPFLNPDYSIWTVSIGVTLMLLVGALSVTAAVTHERDVGEIELQARRLLDDADKLLEARKMESVARLSAGIAHQFNNILLGIVGYAELIEASRPRAASEYAERIKEAAFRASRLTDGLLSFSRQQLLRPRAISLSRLVADLEPLFRDAIRSKAALTLRLGAADDRVRVDPEGIGRAIRTLVERAAKEVPDSGSIVVTVVPPSTAVAGQAAPADESRYCTVVISDSAPPLSEDALRRLFDPFSDERELGPAELDLAAAYGLVYQSGGRLEARSSAKEGNTVVLFLPSAQMARAGLPG